ncbi:hypothetical protein PIB30_043409 [Stylosanthes scabra]|uniref:Uncharacterized protein n=1 Tax=Stylosanthes scabra TaxID=79078 RepID=A0ABU6SFF9_9FABA|nr:hypothetical protein [Stylosanthes scabra]
MEGAAFMADVAKNLKRAASLPVRACTSFKDVGCFMEMMAWHFSGLASIPLLVSMNPRNFPASTAKAHFAEFRRI